MEDIKHFILHCEAYKEERRKDPRMQQPYQEDEDELVGKILFNNNEIENTKLTLYEFWKLREEKRKSIA